MLVTAPDQRRLVTSHVARKSRVELTRREREVLRLLTLRLTDPEIADHLAIGTRTVESHVARILRKLGAANRREAVRIAARLGITAHVMLPRPSFA